MLSLKYEILRKGVKLLSDEMVENIGKVENLKLYDIAFKSSEEDYNKYFNRFCEDNYMFFEEAEKETTTVREYIGRTSSFYITCNSIIGSYCLIKDYKNLTPFKKKILLLDEYLNHEISCSLDTHDTPSVFDDEIRSVSTYENYSDDEIVTDVLEGIKNVLIDEINDINNTYKYIANFKDNQLEYWNESVEYWKSEEEQNKEEIISE